MSQRSYSLRAPRGSFELANDDEKEPVYRKEVAYCGTFTKKNDKTGQVEFELPVTESLIDHWVSTFEQMQKDGITVPVPIGHTTDPESRRGTVIKLEKGMDEEKGVPALFAVVKFNDEVTAKKLKNSDVSLFQPPKITGGNNKTYQRPITHLAITDYPVIPALSEFQPLALSLAEESSQMTIVELASQLGVQVPDGATDDDAAQAIIEAWNMEEPEGDEPPADDLGDDTTPLENPPPVTIPASMARTVLDARKVKIGDLVTKRKISPAVAKELEKRFATEQAVTICMSHEAQGDAGDGFDDTIAMFSLNEPVFSTGERSGPQVRKDGKNPVVADAERRAAAAEKKSARRR